MNTNKELNYRLYIQREEQFVRQGIRQEFSNYDMIRYGKIQAVKDSIPARKANFYQGKGELSPDPTRNIMYHFVIATAMVSRVCVEGGMSQNEAYTLSDVYIRRADQMRNAQEILDLFFEMQVDFTERMHRLATHKEDQSLYVRRAIDYIYDHLHEPVTTEELAKLNGLNRSYFSRLFSKEVGIPAKRYILEAKITTAQNMMENEAYSISDIAFSLGFCSQSAFTAAFRSVTGNTPHKYRETLKVAPQL